MADLILDFLITPTYNTKTIGVADNSTYPNDPPEVEAPTLEVSVPGFDTVSFPFITNDLNVLNSNILGITVDTEEPLPDGVYVFRYSVSPAFTSYVEKSIMRVEQLQEKFADAFMKLDMMVCDAQIKRQQQVALDSINYFINGSIAAANNCAIDEANKLYRKADKMLFDFINRGHCCGTSNMTNFY